MAPSAAATPGIFRADSEMLMCVAPGFRSRGLRAGELALGGVEDAGTGLVGTLVGPDRLDAVLVGLVEGRLALGRGELVVAGPRLVAAPRGEGGGDPPGG